MQTAEAVIDVFLLPSPKYAIFWTILTLLTLLTFWTLIKNLNC